MTTWRRIANFGESVDAWSTKTAKFAVAVVVAVATAFAVASAGATCSDAHG